MVSDKIRSARKCFIICLAIAALIMACVPFVASISAPTYIGLIGLFVFATLFTGPANTMMEMWLVQVNNSKLRIPYGSIRMWASIGFAVMGLIYVPYLKTHSMESLYYIYVVFAIPAILLAFRVPKTENEAGGGQQKRIRLRDMPFKKLLTFWIVSYIIYSMIHQIPGSWKFTYFMYLLEDYGFDASIFAAFMGISAFLEVPTLMISQKIINKFGLVKPLIACLIATAVELALYALGTSLTHLVIGQIIKGLAAGLMMACQIQYINRQAPEGLGVTTQALISSISSITGIVISLVGGFVMEAMGVRPFYTMLIFLQVFSIAVFALSFPLGIKVLKKPRPPRLEARTVKRINQTTPPHNRQGGFFMRKWQKLCRGAGFWLCAASMAALGLQGRLPPGEALLWSGALASLLLGCVLYLGRRIPLPHNRAQQQNKWREKGLAVLCALPEADAFAALFAALGEAPPLCTAGGGNLGRGVLRAGACPAGGKPDAGAAVYRRPPCAPALWQKSSARPGRADRQRQNHGTAAGLLLPRSERVCPRAGKTGATGRNKSDQTPPRPCGRQAGAAGGAQFCPGLGLGRGLHCLWPLCAVPGLSAAGRFCGGGGLFLPAEAELAGFLPPDTGKAGIKPCFI